jgi:hypothetical protein
MKKFTLKLIAATTEAEMAFGNRNVMSILPPMSSLPDDIESTPFYQLASDLFYKGKPSGDLPKMCLHPKFNEVESSTPRFIRSLLGSFEPKHEHKMAGVASIMQELFYIVDDER